MKRRIHIVAVLTTIGAMFMSAHTLHAQAGKSGLAFLKLGVSGRGVGLADATSASVSGTAANFYNPAGLLWRDGAEARTQFMFMHKEWIQDTRVEFLGGMTQLGADDALGAYILSSRVSDIEVRTRPGEAEGTFTSQDLAVGLSYAHRFGDEIRAGISAKYLYEKIFVDGATGFAADLGVQAETPI